MARKCSFIGGPQVIVCHFKDKETNWVWGTPNLRLTHMDLNVIKRDLQPIVRTQSIKREWGGQMGKYRQL